MAPSGQASHKKGIVFLFLYDWNTGIKYKLMTEPNPVPMSWSEFLNIVYHIFGECDQADVWGDFYKEQESIEEEDKKAASTQSIQGSEAVATSQQEGKINEEERHAKETAEDENVEGIERPVESVPDVVLTVDAKKEGRCLKDEDRQEAAGVEESGKESIADYEGMKQHIENQAKIIIEELQAMHERCVQHNWDSLIEGAKNIITRAESIKNMEEVYRNE